MKPYQVALALALACTLARAGELEDGLKAWENKDFATAHKIFSKLAAAGDPEAERQLGEMYGFGEGVPEDLGQARRWIEQSRAHGNKEAATSLALVEQRAARKADIARYTTQYDGSDVALAHFKCGNPEIPESSNTKKKIAEISGKISKWYECYGQFAKNLNAQLPAGKAIPQDIAQLMNSAEFDQARMRMDKAYARVGDEGKREAEQIGVAEGKWLEASKQAARAADEDYKRGIEESANRRVMSLPPPVSVSSGGK